MKATGFFVLTLAAAGLLTACGSSNKKGAAETVIHSVMTTQGLSDCRG